MSSNHDSDPAPLSLTSKPEERVAIQIHEGGIPIDWAKDLAAGPRLQQSGPLLGLAEGLRQRKRLGR